MTRPRQTPTPGHVAELAQDIAAADRHDAIFRAVFLFASRVTPADSIFVALYDSRTRLRRCVYAASLVKDAAGGDRLDEDEDLSIFPLVGLNDGPQSRAIVSAEIVDTPDLEAAVEGLPRVDRGSDFSERPPRSSVAVPLLAEGTVFGAFEVQSTELAAFGEQHYAYLAMAARLAAIAVRNMELSERERVQQEAVLRAFGLALEHRDYETKGHTDRVVSLSLAFGERLDFRPDRLRSLRWGAYLHDVGKIATPDSILLKPASLDEEEFAVIKRHTLIGLEICRTIPFLPAEVGEIVRSHHERWDGSGYPDGLAGAKIPVMARMFSLVDVYDALTHSRPYKRAWTRERALEHLYEQAGRQFDPDLLKEFMMLAEIDRGRAER